MNENIQNNENTENINEPEITAAENSNSCESAESISEKFANIENDILKGIENGSKKKKRRNRLIDKILLVSFAGVITASVIAASVYCIVSDISGFSVNMQPGVSRSDFVLNTSHRPSMPEAYADKNGKYTIEGLANIIKPQIVEIYTYETKNSEEIVGSGSGIIISDDGYIVTNTHVLDGMEKYMVKTFDGKTYNAEISGRDAKTDISVIKIDARGLIPAQFGNSDEVVQGESVVVVGNPAGLNGSITDGIVSGLNRKIRTAETGFEMDCIQTNAAISPGNSGGALVNMYGQVIGITSSKYATTYTEGLGFAITINEAKPIIEELITKGYVSGRVRIGITFYTSYANYMNIMFEEEFGFEIPKELEHSLWIEEISKDCDISNTELKANDFILEMNGQPVSDYSGIETAIKDKVGGDTVTAKCARVSKDGKISYFNIEFKLMEDTSGDY